MALEFTIGMNERPAVAAAKNLTKSLDGIDKSLDQLSDNDFGSEIDKELDKVSRSAGKAGDDIKRELKGGFKEAGDEARQSGREAAASFSGGFDDIGDFLQETAANAFGGFGPLGVAAGIAGAAGIGLITSEIQKQQEEADFLKERLMEAYRGAAEEGRNYIDAAQAVAEATDLMFNPDRADEWKQIQADAKTLMLDTGTLIDANAGKTDAQREVQDRVNALIEEQKSKYTDTDSIVGNLGTSLLGVKNRWGDIATATDEAKAKAEALDAYKSAASEEERAQIQRTKDADQARWESFAAAAQSAKARASGDVVVRLIPDTSAFDYAVDIAKQRAARGVTVPVGVNQIG